MPRLWFRLTVEREGERERDRHVGGFSCGSVEGSGVVTAVVLWRASNLWPGALPHAVGMAKKKKKKKINKIKLLEFFKKA